MARKSLMLLLTLALTASSMGSLLAQDATPTAPTEETTAQSVYLPLVQSGQPTATVEADLVTEDVVTEDAVTEDDVNDDVNEVSEIDPASELGEAIEVNAAGHGWRGDRSNRCGDGRGGNRWGNWRGALEVVGLTADQRLICFDEYSPRKVDTIGAIAGLETDTTLVGMDFRPATGDLYGLGNAGGLYTLNLNNARATLRARLNVALSGSAFGVDFNPTVDRLRIISNDGQNLRVNVDDGVTIVDTPLAYTAGTPTTGVTGAAYTNNDADPNTATTLYDIDALLDQVVIQSPANAGLLAATGKLTVDTAEDVSFDIYSIVRAGATVDVRAMATLTVNERTRLYRINLFTGKARSLGPFHIQNEVIGIAIPLNQR